MKKGPTIEERYPIKARELAFTPCLRAGMREIVIPSDVPPDTDLKLVIDRPVDSRPPQNPEEALAMCDAPFW